MVDLVLFALAEKRCTVKTRAKARSSLLGKMEISSVVFIWPPCLGQMEENSIALQISTSLQMVGNDLLSPRVPAKVTVSFLTACPQYSENVAWVYHE